MEQQDDWLEGVRRWYFGGEAPEGAERDEQIVWPTSSSAAADRPEAPGAASRATVEGTLGADRMQWASSSRAGRPLSESPCREACLR